MTAWTFAQALAAADQPAAALPVIGAGGVRPIVAGMDVWDMWPIVRQDGGTAMLDGQTWWFFLATPRLDDPEARHDSARIRLVSRGRDGWRDHGEALPEGVSPGSREWSGSAVFADDRETVTMYFTAAGRRGGPLTFEQRLFETTGRFERGMLGGWSPPIESVRADGRTYAVARQSEPVRGRVKGFRDPTWCRDPQDGSAYLLFTGSAGWIDQVEDGVIGIAVRQGGQWRLRQPLATALGANSELERPHIVVSGGRYYLFWSTQARRFASGLMAPTGLYGMVAQDLCGPYEPLNGTGLVAANPPEEPFQAYCWWVTGERQVVSFVDYPALAGADPASSRQLRRAAFGGTVAPGFSLELDGASARIVL